MGLGGPLRCMCCGEQEKTGGCVRGLTCGCYQRAQCDLCKHCVEHHHVNCTEAAREQFKQLRSDFYTAVGDLRARRKINIFEYGQKTEKPKTLTGWYRTTPSGDVIDW